MKRKILLALVLIAVLVSVGVGGTLADWVDSEFAAYSFDAGTWQYRECTMGWWKNWDNHLHKYPFLEDDINLFLNEMNNTANLTAYSYWLMPDVDGDSDYDTDDMVALINQKSDSRKAMFLAQYLTQRLNQMIGFQSGSITHDVMKVPSYKAYGNYLGLADPNNASGTEIIEKIEDKYGEPELADDNAHEFEVMKDVCDWLNNLGVP